MVDVKISQLSNVSSSEQTDLFVVSRWSGTEWLSRSINYHDLAHSILGQNVLIVGLLGGEFNTIEDAITEANRLSPSISNPIAILVLPGVYTENPLIVPQYTTISSVDSSKTTLIQPVDSNAVLFTVSINSGLSGLRISDVNGANGVAVKSISGTSDCLLRDIAIRNCTIGFYASGTNSVLRGYQCTVLSSTGTITYGALADNGGNLFLSDSIIRISGSGILTNGVYATGSGTNVTIPTCQITGAINALYCDDGALIDSDSCFIEDSTNAIVIGPTGSDSKINSFGTSVADSSNYDVLIESVTGSISFSGKLNYNKRSIVSGAVFDSMGVDDNNEFIKLTGETIIEEGTNIGYPGSVTLGANVGLDVGEGGSYSVDQYGDEIVEYWKYDASAASGSRLTRYTNNAGTQLTDTGDAIIVGSKFIFSATRMNILVAANIGSSTLIAEHWNGSSWTTDAICGYEKSNFTHRGTTIFQNVETQYIEFGISITDTWASDDNVLDNIPNWDAGFDMYPVRFRNSGALTTGMEFSGGKVRGDDFDVSGAQTVVVWGRYRKTQTDVIPRGTLLVNASNPTSNATVNVSSNISYVTNLSYVNGSVCAASFNIKIPDWADTSSGVELHLGLLPSNSNTGNVNFSVRYVEIDIDETVIDGTASENVGSGTFAVPGVSNELFAAEMLFDISSYSLDHNYMFSVSIERDATVGNPLDTYAGDITIFTIHLLWTRKIIG